MKSIELFAGAGGLGMGISLAGFSPLAVIEYNRSCCETLRKNQGTGRTPVSAWPIIEGDVRSFDYRSIRTPVDFVSGGPPCQPFSIGGKHRAHADTRDMFPEAVRAVRETQPKAFLFENVKGLTRASFATYFEYIRLQLEYPELAPNVSEDWFEHHRRLEQHHTCSSSQGLEYKVVVRVLNAANFGIPQKRERVFFVGFRSDLSIEWSFPEPTHSYDALVWDQIHGDYWERHGVRLSERQGAGAARTRAKRLDTQPHGMPWRTVRDALQGLPDPERKAKKSYSIPNHWFQPGARCYVGHTGSPLDEPAKTLKAGVHGVPGGENMLLRPDGSVRYFTVRESARLQTFPDEYIFHGAWSEAMRQLGNAVPVGLAEMLAGDIACHLNAQTKHGVHQ